MKDIHDPHQRKGCTLAQATAITILAPALAMPSASDLDPTLNPLREKKKKHLTCVLCTEREKRKNKEGKKEGKRERKKERKKEGEKKRQRGQMVSWPVPVMFCKKTSGMLRCAHSSTKCAPFRADSQKSTPLLATMPTG
jgi:hypothetical protein